MVEPRAARSTLRFVDEYCEWYAPPVSRSA